MYYLKCEQNSLKNTIWTNTITAVRVNQWEIMVTEFISDFDSGLKDPAHIQNDLLYVDMSFYRFCLLED